VLTEYKKMREKEVYFFYKLFYALYIFLSFYSCKPTPEKESIKSTDITIYFNKIDLYPVLPECSKIEVKLQKHCFYKAISKRITTYLSDKKLKFKTPVKDSVLVSFTVDTLGYSKITSIKHFTNLEIKNYLDSVIKVSFNQLPKMKPAIKTGVPVKAQFKIPIVIIADIKS
jgi:hypothetical protein